MTEHTHTHTHTRKEKEKGARSHNNQRHHAPSAAKADFSTRSKLSKRVQQGSDASRHDGIIQILPHDLSLALLPRLANCSRTEGVEGSAQIEEPQAALRDGVDNHLVGDVREEGALDSCHIGGQRRLA